MDLYIVTDKHDWDGGIHYRLSGVFSTRDLAEAFVQELILDERDHCRRYGRPHNSSAYIVGKRVLDQTEGAMEIEISVWPVEEVRDESEDTPLAF